MGYASLSLMVLMLTENKDSSVASKRALELIHANFHLRQRESSFLLLFPDHAEHLKQTILLNAVSCPVLLHFDHSTCIA